MGQCVALCGGWDMVVWCMRGGGGRGLERAYPRFLTPPPTPPPPSPSPHPHPLTLTLSPSPSPSPPASDANGNTPLAQMFNGKQRLPMDNSENKTVYDWSPASNDQTGFPAHIQPNVPADADVVS